jgi:hypothetical protein
MNKETIPLIIIALFAGIVSLCTLLIFAVFDCIVFVLTFGRMKFRVLKSAWKDFCEAQ